MSALTDEQARTLGERWLVAGGPVRDGYLLRPFDVRVPAFRVESVTLGYPTRRLGAVTETADLALYWPDVRDPATRGAMLDVVRERWGEPAAYVTPWRDRFGKVGGWVCHVRWDPPEGGSAIRSVPGATEAEALCAALEAAPR